MKNWIYLRISTFIFLKLCAMVSDGRVKPWKFTVQNTDISPTFPGVEFISKRTVSTNSNIPGETLWKLFISTTFTHLEITLHKKMKFFIKDLLSKCNQIRSFLWIWSHFLKNLLMENFIFCSVLGETIRFSCSGC